MRTATVYTAEFSVLGVMTVEVEAKNRQDAITKGEAKAAFLYEDRMESNNVETDKSACAEWDDDTDIAMTSDGKYRITTEVTGSVIVKTDKNGADNWNSEEKEALYDCVGVFDKGTPVKILGEPRFDAEEVNDENDDEDRLYDDYKDRQEEGEK